MGGHGGLNILPQKKWNVYNRDNRTIVERDQRLDRERRQKESQQTRNKVTQQKLKHMKEGIQNQLTNNLITQELQKIQRQNKHINLFENQERIIENREVLDAKILEEMEFIKDKSIDMSSKFLGAYCTQKMKPWYLKNSKQLQIEKSRKQTKDVQIQSVKKTTSIVTKEVYIKQRQQQISRQRSRDDKKIKIQGEGLSKIEQLRLQRKNRQQKQRKRANQLILRHQPKS